MAFPLPGKRTGQRQKSWRSTTGTDVLLQGYYGANNLGDELMLFCLNRWMAGQGLNVTVLAEDARRVEELHSIPAEQNHPILGEFAWVESFIRGKAWRVWSRIARCSAFICGGGDCIRDAIGWRGFTYQVSKILAALVLGKPVYLVNIGISPATTWYGRRVLSWMLRRCSRIIVREKRSLEVCRSFGAGDIAVWAPDIVFSLPDFVAPPRHTEVLRKPYIVVALHGNSNVSGCYEMTAPRSRNLARALDYLVEVHGIAIVFLACQSLQGFLDDHDMHRAVAGQMKQGEHTVFRKWTANPEEISQIFAGARMVIAMRLHAAVLAAAFKKPCVIMPYDAKVSDFGEQFGIRHVLTAESLESEQEPLGRIEAALLDEASVTEGNFRGIWPSMTLEGAPVGVVHDQHLLQRRGGAVSEKS